MRVPGISHKHAAELGWTRVDPKPWRSKLSAQWLHTSGYRLEHCGHPTAHHPWALYEPGPDGQMVLTGAQAEAEGLGGRDADGRTISRYTHGTAWRTLAEPMEWVAAQIARAA